MPFQISPGVSVTETDLTLIVPSIATTPAALCGAFKWGPANEPTFITSEKYLIEVFGTPDRDTEYARYWFTAQNFLEYGNNLRIVRVLQTGENTATSVGTGITNVVATGAGVYNDNSYLTNYATHAGQGPWCARYAGAKGNSLKVVVLDVNTNPNLTDTAASDEYSDFLNYFNDVPGTSVWANSITNSTSINDEIHILVIDAGGVFTGVAGTVLEKFAFVSKAKNSKNADGRSNYYADVINSTSVYIRWLAHPSVSSPHVGGKEWGTDLTFGDGTYLIINGRINGKSVVFGGGANANLVGVDLNNLEGDCAQAYETFFLSGEEIDVSLLIAGPMRAAHAQKVIQTAEDRKDCVAFVSPTNSLGGTYAHDMSSFNLVDALAYRDDLLLSSSYGVMDSGYKLQYDSYNDRYLYIPLNGDVAGCCVRTDLNKDPWFSPAGFDRGRIKNVVRLAYNPGKADRDELYKKSINPVVSFPGEGVVLFGDKTLLSRPSAFDRINVRRLFIVLEKAISTASKFLLFEFNDTFTRNQFKQLVEPYLREISGRRGIQDFRVVCDETNNTPYVIDSNGFVGDIFVKPNRSINFIQLNFVATPTGISFTEVGG